MQAVKIVRVGQGLLGRLGRFNRLLNFAYFLQLTFLGSFAIRRRALFRLVDLQQATFVDSLQPSNLNLLVRSKLVLQLRQFELTRLFDQIS